jgi:hypothetical protein
VSLEEVPARLKLVAAIGASALALASQPAVAQQAPSASVGTAPAVPPRPDSVGLEQKQVEEVLSKEAAPAPTSKLNLGLGIRGRVDVHFNDVNSAGQQRTSEHLSYDTVILTAKYDSPVLFGSAEYRFGAGNFFYSRAYGYQGVPGEVNFLVHAYLGAKVTADDNVTVGVQPMPFDDRYWGNSGYNSLGFVYGLEEVYNAGVTYSHTGDRMTLTGGFFPTTGPAVLGLSRDSARYSVNIVKGDSYLPSPASNTERNMAVGRVQYKLATSTAGALTLTGSAWISTVHSYDTDRNGYRHAFALSLKDDRGPIHAKLLVARQDIDPKNAGRSDLLAVGTYDFSYNIAAHSSMVFGELSHPLDTGRFPFKLNAYVSYADVVKDGKGFPDTQRINVGLFWNDKASGKIKIWSEVLFGRNDPYVGAGQFISGAAQGGDSRWKASAIVIAGYYL